MNDVLKFLSKSLKPYGYHVRKFSMPNLLKIKAYEGEENAHNIKAVRLAVDDHPFAPQGAALDHMVVYLRTCIRDDRNIDTTKRVTQVNLLENARRCVRSLVEAVNYACDALPDKTIELVVLDDRSSAGCLEVIQAELQALDCAYVVETTRETGQGKSLHQQFDTARGQNALVYFCEDDYLHERDALTVMWGFYDQIYAQMGTHCFLHPQEHRAMYSNHYPSYILLGADRHWRTIRDATHTFMTHGYVVRDFWQYFENTKYVGVRKKRKKGSEAQTTNKLFRHIPAFSPMKPAAVHLQFEGTLPPFYDWRPLWQHFAKAD